MLALFASYLLCAFLAVTGSAATGTPQVASGCVHALAQRDYLPHSEEATWCSLAAGEVLAPCTALASAVCGILRLRRGDVKAGSAHLTRAVAGGRPDWVSHSYLGASLESVARQLLSSGGDAASREQVLSLAVHHFERALALRRATPPLPRALLDLAQPPTLLFRSAGTCLHWLGREAEARAVFAAGVAEGIGWTSPLQRPTLPLPLSAPCPTPFLPSSDPRLAPLLQTLTAAIPALKQEYLAAVAREGQQRPLLALETAGLEATQGWGVHTVAVDGAFRASACVALPVLCALAREQPLVNATAVGQVKYSVLRRGAHILPHAGPTVARLRVHCTLQAFPEEAGRAWIRVGEETREWRDGDCWVFDESFEHEVLTGGSGARIASDSFQRVVLILDIVNVFLARLEDVKAHGASTQGWRRHKAELSRLWAMGSGKGLGDL
jgi:hypothetical protein